MTRRFSLLSAILTCLLFPVFLWSCDDSGPSSRGADAVAPPDEPGPYGVGVTTIYLTDESRTETWGNRSRVLPAEIWYPSNGAGGRTNRISGMMGELPAEVLALLELLYGEQVDDLLNTPTAALRDAEILGAAGPFPVVLFSHGFAGLRYQNYTLCEHLASHGFVVVAVDHYGNCILVNVPGTPLVPLNPLGAVDSYLDRVQDVEFVYGELQAMNRDPRQPWYGLLDLGRFAVSGHSFGGLTTLQCGSRFEFVKAIAALNPAWSGLPGDFAPPFEKPFFLLQGENDTWVGSMNEATRRLLDEAASTRKIFLNLLHGGHYSATDVCTIAPPSIPFLVRECEPPFVDHRLSNRIANGYLTGFFRFALLGDTRHDGYLKANHFPEEVEFAATWE